MLLTLSRHCPFCYSEEVFRSRFRGLEFLLPLFLLRPVRCNACFQRHYRFLFRHTPERPTVSAGRPPGRKLSA